MARAFSRAMLHFTLLYSLLPGLFHFDSFLDHTKRVFHLVDRSDYRTSMLLRQNGDQWSVNLAICHETFHFGCFSVRCQRWNFAQCPKKSGTHTWTFTFHSPPSMSQFHVHPLKTRSHHQRGGLSRTMPFWVGFSVKPCSSTRLEFSWRSPKWLQDVFSSYSLVCACCLPRCMLKSHDRM